MKNITSAFLALSLLGSSAIGLGFPQTAAAQSTLFTCEAQSPTAYGLWRHSSLNVACNEAMLQCLARTPPQYSCRVTRWWRHY